jgi:hypothetical protein
LSAVALAKAEAKSEALAKEDDNGFSLFTFFAFPDNLCYNTRSCGLFTVDLYPPFAWRVYPP